MQGGDKAGDNFTEKVHDSAKDMKWDSNVNFAESKSADVSMSPVRTGGDQEPPSQRWDNKLYSTYFIDFCRCPWAHLGSSSRLILCIFGFDDGTVHELSSQSLVLSISDVFDFVEYIFIHIRMLVFACDIIDRCKRFDAYYFQYLQIRSWYLVSLKTYIYETSFHDIFLFQMKILRLCPFIVNDTDFRIHTSLVSYLHPYSCRCEVHDQ